MKKELYWGNHFWAKGYCIDTVGMDAEMIRKYVKYQEKLEKTLNLESAVEQGFVGNPGVPGKASFAVNGYSLNKNDNAAGCVGIFHKFL